MAIYSRIAYYDAAGNRLAGGGVADKYSADVVEISSAPSNGVSAVAGALFAEKLTSAAFDGGTGVLTLTLSGAASPVTVNLATLAADKFLSGSSFNPATNELTLTMSDATVYTVNLADLVYSSVGDTTTTTFNGDGTSASPLSVDVKVSGLAGNALVVDAQGLFVPDFSLTPGTPPAATAETGISTNIIGGTTATLGNPAGFFETPDGKLIPYYNPA